MASFTGRLLRGLAGLFPAQGGESQAPSRLATADVQPVVDVGPVGSWGYSPSIDSQDDAGFFTVAFTVKPTGINSQGARNFGLYDKLPAGVPADASIWIYDVWVEITDGEPDELLSIYLGMASPGGSQFLVVQAGQGVPRYPLFVAAPADSVDLTPLSHDRWIVWPSRALPRPMHVPKRPGSQTFDARVASTAAYVAASTTWGLLIRVVPSGMGAP